MTQEALQEILHAWGNIGTNEAREIGARHGINASKVKKLAIKHKVRAKKKLNRKIGCPNDPRWRWAIERGSIVA